mgnify:CR=1 FL=1
MNIKLFIIDVDGTMTDAGIYYDEHGNAASTVVDIIENNVV